MLLLIEYRSRARKNGKQENRSLNHETENDRIKCRWYIVCLAEERGVQSKVARNKNFGSVYLIKV